MQKINIKTLSVNSVWQGRRFKTKKYLDYEKKLFYLLPNIKIPEGKLKLKMIIGFSSKLADLDNIAKPIIDIMQRAYQFNDKRIYEIILKKKIVKKGNEYINFKITTKTA